GVDAGGCRRPGALQKDRVPRRSDGSSADGVVPGVLRATALADRAGSGCHGRSGARESGGAILPWLLPGILLSAFVHSLRRVRAVRTAAEFQYRCLGWGAGGSEADCGADPDEMAAGGDRAAGRRWVQPRWHHELVRREPRGLPV